ncbi:hypothetical protein DM867_03825 [Halosegnis rubeus]|uniref:Uncharacterized protein n=1 Tax=Halosegnis rubeus TaxID=2212850 RepID=A0A5N5UG83_9EURY|nr:DUF6360 family protein [Halosegnis rubeus]KAB7515216.1 hypothetical protein DMP03_08205 [Halosegnis rubeus]KAB7516270.1 hypothetical protein DM867_03825 [Halosegnis rubeus]KAB7517742.1 hypothetical protein DP108_09295 [Halosegnis rubeus]
MADRIMRVNAYTTLDLVDAEAEGHNFEEEAYATVNVTSPRRNPDHVEFALELDNTTLETLDTHADRLRLNPEQARTLAAALESEADAVEDAQQ